MVSLSKSLKNNSTNILLVLLLVILACLVYYCLKSRNETFFLNDHENNQNENNQNENRPIGGCLGFGPPNASIDSESGNCVVGNRVVIPRVPLERMIAQRTMTRN